MMKGAEGWSMHRQAAPKPNDVVDAHTTGDAVTSAQITIEHQNHALGNLAHPDRRLEVKPNDKISFS
jgi:hypothetical protein